MGFLWADVEGLSLTAEDRDILAHPALSGVILFARNYESRAQLCSLTKEIRAVSPHLIITVDQEGGRVQRFRTDFTELPAMGHWGAEFQTRGRAAELDFANTLKIMVTELRDAGVYSTLTPVLDIDFNRNTVIGHRSFGNTPDTVTTLGHFFIDQFHALNMPVTGKHFPGHGWVTLDSHFELPIDERALSDIMAQDLQPFMRLAPHLDAIMLAHVVYEQVESKPVCFSRFWIENMLRKQMRYDGLVMTDDLSMKAVATTGSYADRTMMALEAGADIAMVCNSRSGVVDVLDHVPVRKNESLQRRLQYYGRYLD